MFSGYIERPVAWNGLKESEFWSSFKDSILWYLIFTKIPYTLLKSKMYTRV